MLAVNDDIVITSTSAITAIGPNAMQTCAAIKAGVSPFTEHPYIRCTPNDPEWDEGLPTYVASLPLINPVLNSIERFTHMAINSLNELFSKSLFKRAHLAKTGLLIALPIIDSPIEKLNLNSNWLADLQKQTGLSGLKLAKVSHEGHIGVFSLIKEAIRLINTGELEQCIVGGVDSYILEDRIAYLDDTWRVKTMRNVDGFIPGEAASMLLLEKRSNASLREIEPMGSIVSIGEGMEINSFNSQLSSTGLGLSDAINASLLGLVASEKIKSIYCDFNGESYFAQEWGLMRTRHHEIFTGLNSFNHPAENYGDVGAATGGLLAINALINMQAGNDNEHALIAVANDDGKHRTILLKSN